jgi:hypothetical protein
VDIWWGAYASRALAPAFAACGAATGLAVGWYLWARHGSGELTVRYTTYALVGLIWLFPLLFWAYNTLTFTYRLTNRRLLVERSFFSGGRGEVELARISGVVVLRGPWEKRTGVGRIRILADDSRQPVLLLAGIDDPGRVAAEIRHLAKQARESGIAPVVALPAADAPVAGHLEGEI